MDPQQEATVREEIENALRESPSSATWDGVTQLSIEDPRSISWKRYKERLSGVDAEQWVTPPQCDSELIKEVGSESLIWKDVTNEILRTFNSLFPALKVVDLNDENCTAVTVDEILNAYVQATDNAELLKNSIFIDVICDPIVKKFSEKMGEVGKCCTTEWLRTKSKSVPLNEICGKRTDLTGTTDWVMRRYGGSRRESSMYMNLMWWSSYYMFLTCGKYGAKKADIDVVIGVCAVGTLDQISSGDGDRTTHRIEETELANAAKSSAAKSFTPSIRVRSQIEMVVTGRKFFAKKYNELYTLVSRTADPKNLTPTAYLKSRYADGSCTTFYEMQLASDFGEAFNTMTGSIYLPALLDAALYYNDLSDAVTDMKYMETHNYVICAKIANPNYSFSDHCEALYVALTTFDEPVSSYNDKIKRHMCVYRFGNAIYHLLWPRYRVGERARRYVGALSKEERNELIQRGRKCIQGEVQIDENIWLDVVCSNYNNRRAVIRSRGYVETLLYVLGVEDDQTAKDHIQRAVKAIGMRPFDTGSELVTSLGSLWLAEFALRTVKGLVSYDSLVVEFSDLLRTLSESGMPIISENTITPCESVCGPLAFRLMELLTIVSEMNDVVGEGVMSTVASVLTMVSLDPFRCVAHQADMLLLSD